MVFARKYWRVNQIEIASNKQEQRVIIQLLLETAFCSRKKEGKHDHHQPVIETPFAVFKDQWSILENDGINVPIFLLISWHDLTYKI